MARLALTEITSTVLTQSRAELFSKSIVKAIKNDLTARKKADPTVDLVSMIEPVDVFGDPGTGELKLSNGHSRYWAAVELGLDEIEVNIHDGDEEAAYLFSCRANDKNSGRRSKADKRASVQWALYHQTYTTWSNERIGDLVCVDAKTVWNGRDQLGIIPTSVLGRDGKWYPYDHGAKASKQVEPGAKKARALLKALEGLIDEAAAMRIATALERDAGAHEPTLRACVIIQGVIGLMVDHMGASPFELGTAALEPLLDELSSQGVMVDDDSEELSLLPAEAGASVQ